MAMNENGFLYIWICVIVVLDVCQKFLQISLCNGAHLILVMGIFTKTVGGDDTGVSETH